MISNRKLVTLVETGQLMACYQTIKAMEHGHYPINFFVINAIACEYIEDELRSRGALKNKKDCQGANPNSPISSNTFENNKEQKQI